MVNHVFNEMHFILTFMLQLKYIIINMLAIIMDYLFLISKQFYLLISIMILMSFNIIYKDHHYLEDYSLLNLLIQDRIHLILSIIIITHNSIYSHKIQLLAFNLSQLIIINLNYLIIAIFLFIPTLIK